MENSLSKKIDKIISLIKSGENLEAFDLMKESKNESNSEFYKMAAEKIAESSILIDFFCRNENDAIEFNEYNIKSYSNQYDLNLAYSIFCSKNGIEEKKTSKLTGYLDVFDGRIEDGAILEFSKIFNAKFDLNISKEEIEELKLLNIKKIQIDGQIKSEKIEITPSNNDVQELNFVKGLIERIQIVGMNIATNKSAMTVLTIGAVIGTSLLGDSAFAASAADSINDVKSSLNNIPDSLAGEKITNLLQKMTDSDEIIKMTENVVEKKSNGTFKGKFTYQLADCSVSGDYNSSGEVDSITIGSGKCREAADVLASVVRKTIKKTLMKK